MSIHSQIDVCPQSVEEMKAELRSCLDGLERLRSDAHTERTALLKNLDQLRRRLSQVSVELTFDDLQRIRVAFVRWT
jgi:hypothetical protein